jgi:hypothetical protein
MMLTLFTLVDNVMEFKKDPASIEIGMLNISISLLILFF